LLALGVSARGLWLFAVATIARMCAGDFKRVAKIVVRLPQSSTLIVGAIEVADELVRGSRTSAESGAAISAEYRSGSILGPAFRTANCESAATLRAEFLTAEVFGAALRTAHGVA
jgi:hypothetical protein